MKAIVLDRYGTPDDLRLAEVERPTPADNEILIKVKAASINDWDWGLVRGKPFYIRLICGLRQPKIAIPGVDIAGIVEAVGEDVTRFRPGDAVYGDLSDSGFGGFAEYVCAPEDALSPKPDNMSFEAAAAVPHAAALAVQGLFDLGQIESGQQVLINGAGGGVGTYGAQIAKTVGVELTGVDSGPKLAMMRDVGFDHVIDYTQQDFTALGQRYDLILDTRTNRSPFRYARALKPGGRYVTVGADTSRLIQMLLLGPILGRLTRKSYRILALQPNKGLEDVGRLIAEGQLRSITDGPYTLEQVPQAITHFGQAHHLGKVVVTV